MPEYTRKERLSHWYKYNIGIIAPAFIGLLSILSIGMNYGLFAGTIAFFAGLGMGMALMGIYEKSNTHLPLSVEKHLHHTIGHAMNTINESEEPVTPMRVARGIADELVVEGLVRMDDYDVIKITVLSHLDEKMDKDGRGFFNSKDVEKLLVPHVID